MTKNMVIKCIAAGSGLIAAFTVGAAGLALSDAPMFVTETVEPNVIISPVYKYEYNETSMMDLPFAEYIVCSGIPITGVNVNCSLGGETEEILTSSEWNNLFGAALHGWRVTPWPGACLTANSAACRTDSIDIIYSKISVYPNDRENNLALTEETLHPLYFRHNSSGGYNFYREDAYPEAGVSSITNNNRGKVRYVRSNKNFLYFNQAVADGPGRTGTVNDHRGYEPWPNLGGYTFDTYSISNAATPYYNPLKKQQDSIDIKADLSSPGFSYMYTSPGGSGYLPVHLGQYWEYQPAGTNGSDGAVWKSTSYTRKIWGGGGAEAMSVDDKINFAHWFTYWRSSYLATRGILSNLIFEMGPDRANLLDRFRVGIHYGNQTTGEVINYTCWALANGFTLPCPAQCKSISNVTVYPLAVKTVKGADLVNALAQDIFNPSSIFTSYNHNRVTDYFKTDEPYQEAPGVSGSPTRSCRRNYEIIVTPDYTGLRHDTGTNIGTVSDQYELTLELKYRDGVANQWGDVGAYGWVTDLMPSLNNTLLPGVRDTQTQQHLVRYVVGPKAAGIKFPDSTDTFTEADTVLNTMSSAAWAASRLAFSGIIPLLQYSIDDLWHMALNSRGFFYQSNDVRDTVQKLLAAFNDVLVRNVSGSAVATNTTSLQLGGRVYQATVETDWKGHLRAYNIAPNAGNTALVLDFSAPVWDLAEKVSAVAWGDRKILTWNGSTGVPFRWADIGTSAQNRLKTAVPAGVTGLDDYGGKLLEYLRGSGTCENDSTTACTSGVAYTFRRRNLERSNFTAYSAANPNGRNVLGDIANSNPWLTTAPTAGLSDVDYPGYNQHRTTHKTRGDVLYVGANDGMLHAVDAGTTVANQGKELFAYIPSFVQADLYRLGQSNYDHRYFVDGSPFSAEAQIGSAWKTVLAGGANKGGKGYYLLDVTNVGKTTAVTESDAASIVLWEFTGSPDLHYTYNLPIAYPLPNGQARQIARMNDGKWALIVGNGYPDAAGKKACLFILYLSGPGAAGDTEGADYHSTGYHKLCAGATTYAADDGLDSNGLSTPTPVDTNGDKKVDVIYAGDLNGNMWRFDVSSTTAANWAVDYAGAPLFVAINDAGIRQPIIAPPEVMPYTAGTASGQLLLFGTGKFIEGSDRANTNVQTFYGVWDRGVVEFSNLTRNRLAVRETNTPVVGASVTYRTQSTNLQVPVSYCTAAAVADCGTSPHLGWYWDMPEAGERLTGRVTLVSGTVLFNTFFPLTETYDCDGAGPDTTLCTRLDPCQYGGDGWLMGLNAETGLMETRFPVFDVNLDGSFNDSDTKAAGVKVGAALGGTTFARGIGDSKVGIYSPTNMGTAASEGGKMTTTINVPPGSTGRVSWYELMD